MGGPDGRGVDDSADDGGPAAFGSARDVDMERGSCIVNGMRCWPRPTGEGHRSGSACGLTACMTFCCCWINCSCCASRDGCARASLSSLAAPEADDETGTELPVSFALASGPCGSIMPY